MEITNKFACLFIQAVQSTFFRAASVVWIRAAGADPKNSLAVLINCPYLVAADARSIIYRMMVMVKLPGLGIKTL